jgi:glyoxylase-like metal-dependent hydrolase (beta-lactamase superfamily II)/rhodanese-related sulfurtransferase
VFFRQYQLDCLSLYSYMIGDEGTGRAVVIDPQRDVSQYLAEAEAHGLRIERVIETHFHADFLSGHLELAEATGAVISYGEGAVADFPVTPLADGDRLELGDVVLEIRATPGHTPESISIVVYEQAGAPPWAVLTGDTLFIGDVGRPDLLVSAGWTPDDLARRLYRSLRGQLMTLPDDTKVFPAHGAGSACGRNLSVAAESTIGDERTNNYALGTMTEDRFVEVVTEGQTVAPLYFAYAADANRRTRELLDDHEPPPILDLERFEAARAAGALVIDTRSPDVFASGHLRGSVNVGLDGRFAEYAGDVARPGQDLVVVTDPGRETEARVRMARIGFDRVVGAVTDVEQVLFDNPSLATASSRLPARDVAAWLAEPAPVTVLDVRTPGEQSAGVIEGAILMPLPLLLDHLDDLDRREPIVVYCAGGYRSSAAASVLRANGFGIVAEVLGGFSAWEAAGLPTIRPAITV